MIKQVKVARQKTYPMTHSCKFCNKPTTFTIVEEIVEHGLMVSLCKLCNVEYLFWSDKNIAATSIYTTINSKFYRFTDLPRSKLNKRIYLLHDNRMPAIPGTTSFQGQLIKEFKSDADINPSNVNSKISTIITFL